MSNQPPKPKLSTDEADDLHDLVQHDGINVLLKQIEALVSEFERKVLNLNLSDSADDRPLIIAKARAEGARQLSTAISARVATLKAQTRS